MLVKLLTKDRIKKVKSVKDWKQAIEMASEPLIKDNSIKREYVDAMIDAILKFGPYIVLADEFALPHASGDDMVNETSMSMLIVEENIDLLGKEVKIFLVLAAADSDKHLEALQALVGIISDNDKLEMLKTLSVDKIISLIEKEEVN